MIRRQNILLAITFLLFSFSLTIAQSITGTVVDKAGLPEVGALILLDGTDYEAVTNARGIFRLYDIPQGEYRLKAELESGIRDFGMVSVIDNEVLKLGEISVGDSKSSSSSDGVGEISLTENDFDSDGITGADISSVLTANNDPFVNAAAYNLSSGRYRQRGYGNEDQVMSINGMPMNDLDDGRVGWSTWGGLNDILRVSQSNYDIGPSAFSFGGMLGARNIDLRASVQRPQTKLVYNLSNRSYQHRTMVTHSSGELDNGLAYTISASHRWGNSGYTPGTFYDAYAYALLVDKKINDKHLLNISIFGAPTKRGRGGVSTQEVYDLAGTNYYNPNWGYQNGEVRNSRVSEFHQPYFMLRHDWTVSSNVEVSTTLGYNTGTFGNSRLDWFDAPDPRPDYYRRLPSYQLTDEGKQVVTDYLKEDPARLQVDFDRLISINKGSTRTFDNVNGGTDSFSGLFSKYIIESQHFDNKKLSFNSVVNAYLTDAITLTGGLNYLKETNHQYRVVEDLLGGEFYIDLDKFAERDFPDNNEIAQNDLLNPNRILKEGDTYGWNFDMVTTRAGGWLQAEFSFKKLDYFVGVELSSTSAHRFGYYQNGKFKDNSLGKSPTHDFLNGGIKGGITYKLDGRNYFYGRGTYRTRAPFSRNIFLSPRTRYQAAPENGLKDETIFGGEAGYVFKFPGISGRLSAYYTEFKDKLRNTNIYFDASNSFGNYLLLGIDQKHQGLELGVDVKLSNTFSAEVAIGVGAYQYNSRPTSTFTADNDARDPELPPREQHTIYLKNYYLPGTQNAGSFTLSYNSPHNWFVNLTANYFNNINIDLFPERRTDIAVGGIVVPSNEELVHTIIDQYELEDQFTLNLFAGKSFKVSGKYIFLYASVNNLLNNKKFVTGGFEQYRYRDRQPSVFPERLFYSWGTNYSIGLSLSFDN